MNPWDLSASDLLVWGIVLHLIADWPLQNDWMARHKMERGIRGKWYIRHQAAYVHAWMHGLLLAFIFGWAAVFLGVIHLIIDTRVPVVWWSKFVGQTQPKGHTIKLPVFDNFGFFERYGKELPLYDVGLEVRFWTDQVFHIACLAVAALLVGS